MLTCVLCNENWVLMHSLCEECKKIRQLGNLYGMKKVHTILNRVLLREEIAINHRTETSKKIQENISENIAKQKPKTRSTTLKTIVE
mgnify:CR=1 FL=1|tara:strand:- start:4320 stop:4580 length:261 start_codon:yes stop_codon:yes gene_type:complete